MKLPAEMRSIAASEFIEEVTAHTLGTVEVRRFWQECFGPQSPRFFLTRAGSSEHVSLWSTSRTASG